MEYVIRVSVDGNVPDFVLCDVDLMTPLDLAYRVNAHEIYKLFFDGHDIPEYSYVRHKLSQLGSRPMMKMDIFTSEEKYNDRYSVFEF